MVSSYFESVRMRQTSLNQEKIFSKYTNRDGRIVKFRCTRPFNTENSLLRYFVDKNNHRLSTRSVGSDKRVVIRGELYKMLPLDGDADLNDYPVDYRNLVHELNKNSAWITAATYIANKIKTLGNPWLRRLEQAGNCSNSPGDLLLIQLKRLDLCKVGILCEIFRACDLPDALYIVYGSVPMELDEHLHCTSNGKISNEVAFGETFCLTCKASGLPPPRYQWFHGNIEMPNETSSILSLLISSPDQEGEYQCRVRQYDRDEEVLVGEEFSRCAPLKIKPTEPEIIKQPVSVRVKLGDLLCLTCKAESHPIPNYQWYKEDKLLSGQDSDTLRIKGFKRENKGRYYCIVSNIAKMKGIKSNVSEVTVDHPRQTAKLKIALLIANSKYANYTAVPKAEDDAVALARVLESMDFQVRCLRNLTLHSMRAETSKFGEILGKGVYGLFYFGGHGFATDSNSGIMIPIDAPGPSENEYDSNFCENELMYHLQQNECAALAIIEDMCQWQPTENQMPKLYESKRKAWTYKQKTDPVRVYSTCPGSVSIDLVKGKNGAYMTQVLKHITSDKPIEEVFTDIAESFRESASKITKDQKPTVTFSPKTPYRYLTDAVASKGIQLEVGSTLDQFMNFRPNTVNVQIPSVFRADGTQIPNKRVACRITVQPLKRPFLNDILLTVSDLDDWEVTFEDVCHEQVQIVSMNLGECHIFNNLRRVAPDRTQGLVHMRITKHKGTKDEIRAAGALPYLEWVPRILKDVWLGKFDY